MKKETIGEKTPQQIEAEILNKVYKGADMGAKAIEELLNIANDIEFCKVVKEHLNGYMQIQAELSKMICAIDGVPKGINAAENAMLKMSIMTQSVATKDTKTLAKMAFQGTNMGVLETQQIVNLQQLSDETQKYVKQVLQRYESFAEELKIFL